ncbi:hypothetical protein B0H14DRAFT_2797279 [Mycena olivaceomarginata]|nr:hypothetical protein B0H14DRAFT_2797279 [Mycena olivaceomarginata]
MVGAVVPRRRGEVACRYRVRAYARMDTARAERLQPRLVRPSTRAPHIRRRRRPRRKGRHRLGCSQTLRLRAGSVPAVAACARQGGRGRIYGGGWDGVACGYVRGGCGAGGRDAGVGRDQAWSGLWRIGGREGHGRLWDEARGGLRNRGGRRGGDAWVGRNQARRRARCRGRRR